MPAALLVESKEASLLQRVVTSMREVRRSLEEERAQQQEQKQQQQEQEGEGGVGSGSGAEEVGRVKAAKEAVVEVVKVGVGAGLGCVRHSNMWGAVPWAGVLGRP